MVTRGAVLALRWGTAPSPSAGIRVRTALAYLVFLAVVTRSPAFSQQPPTDPQPDGVIEQLIEQLADDDFDVREKASRRLVDIGKPAVVHLRKRRSAGDSELRMRVVRILRVIEREEVRRQLDLFLSSDHPDDLQIPGWKLFRQMFGGEEASRRQFAAIYQDFPELFQAVDADRQQVLDEFEQLANEINTQQNNREPVSDQSLAAAVFLATNPNVLRDDLALPLRIERQLGNLFIQGVVKQAVEDGAFQGILLQGITRWIVHGQGVDDGNLIRRVQIAKLYQVAEGIQPALECLARSDIPGFNRQEAVSLIAQFGNASHVSAIERLLADRTTIYSRRPREGEDQQVMTVKISDIALAAMVRLTGQNYRDYGFPEAAAVDDEVLVYHQLGFSNEEQRQQAIEKWRQYQARSNATNDPPRDK